MHTPDKRRWWSYLRLSLRGLMVLVLVMGGGLGVLAHFMRSVAIQREAVAAVRTSGGTMLYDFQFEGNNLRRIPGSNAISQEVPGWPKWIVDRLGPDCFGYVREVHFGSWGAPSGARPLSPKAVAVVLRQKAAEFQRQQKIKQLSPPTNFSAINMPVTDSDLARLESLVNLRVLIITDRGPRRLMRMTNPKLPLLEDLQITDAGLAHLKRLTSLEELNLAHAQIGDAGLVHLMGLTHLERLKLDGTRVTDAGLVPLLRSRKGWTDVSLDDTNVTDRVLQALENATSLGSISLCNTEITDNGLAHLKGLTMLHTLNVGETRITNAGLKHLKGLTNLTMLRIGSTKISDTGIYQLRKSLPGLWAPR